MTVFRGSNPFHSLPAGTKGLIVACGVAYLLQFVPTFITYFSLTPALVIKKFFVWQLVTYAFLHGGFFHFLINMWVLWMFGTHIESYWGTRTFLKYYFLCVVGAAVAQILIAPNSSMVGASGAIYGLLLAFGFLFPDAVIYIFFLFPMKAIHAVIVLGAMALAFSMNTGTGSNVAHFAHLGGMLTGYLYFKAPLWLGRFRGGSGLGLRDISEKFHVIRPEKKEDDITDQVDRILDKISRQGISSLTDEEHAIMKQYSQRRP